MNGLGVINWTAISGAVQAGAGAVASVASTVQNLKAPSNPALAQFLPQPVNTNPAPSTPLQKSNTALYVGLGVGGLAIAGTILFFVTRKKKK